MLRRVPEKRWSFLVVPHATAEAMTTLRDLEKAATPPTWRVVAGPGEALYVVTGKDDFLTGPLRPENATFIAALRGAAPLYEELREAARLVFHARDCGVVLFGEGRCPTCSALHDPTCGNKVRVKIGKGAWDHRPAATEPHEIRWCDGNPFEVASKQLRAAHAALDRYEEGLS